MLRTNLVVALRYFRRSSLFSIINITGLVSGITASALLFLFVWDELRVDRFHVNADRIHLVTLKGENGSAGIVTPGPLGPALKDEFSEIELMTRVGKWSGTFRHEDVIFEENNIYFADQSLLKMFDFPLVMGEVNNVLLRPDEVLLTESMAAKYFGPNWRQRTDVMGAQLTLNGNELFMVSGVLQDPPAQATLQFDFLLSFQYMVNDKFSYQWGSNNFNTFLLLNAAVNSDDFVEHANSSVKKYSSSFPFSLSLQPLTSLYLNPQPGYDWNKHGNKQYVYIFSIVGVMILAIASFNYINLATARARKRSREVGIRKVSGATRLQLFAQFMTESIMIVLVSVLIARSAIDILLPFFNNLTGKELTASEFQKPLWVLLAGITLFVSFLSGVYPAIVLSSFKPVSVLKGIASLPSGSRFRPVLVTAQFAISMILIIGTIVIYNQMIFVRSKNTGFDKSELIFIRLGGAMRDSHQALRNAFMALPYVKGASASTSNLVNADNGSNIDWPGKPEGEDIVISQINADESLLPMLGIRMLEGRIFNATDSNKYILNKEAVAAMGLTVENAIGLPVEFWGTKGTVIGVTENFHYRPLYHPIGPLILRHAPKEFHFVMMVKVEAGHVAEFIKNAEFAYKNLEHDYPFTYGFVEEKIQAQYERDQAAGSVIFFFSALSILISIFGLFGLMAYAAEERIREFGIRKVLGANGAHIFAMLSRQFARLLLIAFTIATPIAWMASNHWLASFSYKIMISPAVFIFTLIGVSVGSALVIGAQTVRVVAQRVSDILKVES